METEVLPINPACPESDVIRRAASILSRGHLVAFPTETVYGLGANALDAEAAQGIFNAKGRPAKNPLIVHLPDVSTATQVTDCWPGMAQTLAKEFWPGPLTLVLPKKSNVPATVTGGQNTVAIRIPKHPVAQAILRAVDFPIAAPSANRSTRLSPTLAEHVLRDLKGLIPLILDGGPTPGGLESTVLDVSGDVPRLLRPGLISVEQIESVLKKTVARNPATLEELEKPRSPGLDKRHYAPRTPLQLSDAEDGGRALVESAARDGKRVGWVPFGNQKASAPTGSVIVMPLPLDPATYSARLYATLHTLDILGTEKIIVALPPNHPEWFAVRDRLFRAASPPD